MKQFMITSLAALTLFANCKPRSYNTEGATKSVAVNGAGAWFNENYTHENGGIMLTLKYNGESSLQFAGRSPWGFVGQLELEGTAHLSGVLREKVQEGTKPCYQFRISSTNDGSAYPNGQVKVSMEWDKDITPSFKAICAQKGDFYFASKVVPGMFKRDNAPVSAWWNKGYMKDSGGLFLSLKYGEESSISSTGRAGWGFVGDLSFDGTAKLIGILRQKVKEGTKRCYQFRISTINDGSAYPNGQVKVSFEWDEDITESFKNVCTQMSDFAYVRDIVPGMYNISN